MDHGFRRIVELSSKLKEEKRYLEEELRTEYNFEEIVGESRDLKTVLKQVETVAATDKLPSSQCPPAPRIGSRNTRAYGCRWGAKSCQPKSHAVVSLSSKAMWNPRA